MQKLITGAKLVTFCEQIMKLISLNVIGWIQIKILSSKNMLRALLIEKFKKKFKLD